MKKLKIATRGSSLALWQADYVKSAISVLFPQLLIQIVKIKTKGDRILERELREIGGKGVFVKEIEDSVLAGETDIAVHSLKDLPTTLPDGLTIGAMMKRQNPFDVLVSRNNIKLSEHTENDFVGTGSLRRKSQLLKLYPGLNVVPVRGNIDTRVKKIGNDGLTSVVLAAAGLERLGMEGVITERFDQETMVPAPGQGIIAVECRNNDSEVKHVLSEINHKETEIAAIAERSFLARLGGDCTIPAGCYAEVHGNTVTVTGVLTTPDGSKLLKDKIQGQLHKAYDIGSELAVVLLGKGGSAILEYLNKDSS